MPQLRPFTPETARIAAQRSAEARRLHAAARKMPPPAPFNGHGERSSIAGSRLPRLKSLLDALDRRLAREISRTRVNRPLCKDLVTMGRGLQQQAIELDAKTPAGPPAAASRSSTKAAPMPDLPPPVLDQTAETPAVQGDPPA